MRVILKMDIPDALGHELKAAARTSSMTIEGWAAQVVEAEIATRLLEDVAAGRCGPRMRTAEPEG